MAKTEELEAQLNLARKDIEALVSLAGKTAKEAGTEAAGAATAQLDDLSDDARHLYLAAINEGRKTSQAAQDQIRAHPMAATGIAFVLGLLAASFLARR